MSILYHLIYLSKKKKTFDIPSVGDLGLWTVVLCSVAWLVGWALILEYTIGGAAVARGISPNLVQ